MSESKIVLDARRSKEDLCDHCCRGQVNRFTDAGVSKSPELECPYSKITRTRSSKVQFLLDSLGVSHPCEPGHWALIILGGFVFALPGHVPVKVHAVYEDV